MSKSILIIEDKELLRELYELVLTMKGYAIFITNNDFEGLKQLVPTAPNIVLLDGLMPVMDSRELLRNSRTNDFQSIKIVAYKNFFDSTTEAELLSLGTCRLVLKLSTISQD